jgi:heme exporter protein C
MRWSLAILLCIALTAAAACAAAVWAPTSDEGGDAYRMLYAHIPLAAHTLLAFTIATVASAVYLAKGSDTADRLARAAMACGVWLGAAMLATGMIWARLAWNQWWDFRSPKLLFALLLWVLMVGYFLIRAGRPGDARQKTIAAVYCLIAFLDVPLVYFSSRLAAGDPHPESISLGHWQMHVALALSFAAATALHGLMLAALMRRCRDRSAQ